MRTSIFLLIAFTGILNAQDIRDKVVTEDDKSLTKNIVDPNDSFFGHKIGTTEDAVFAKIGKPQAYMRLNKETTAAIYDNSRAFIFTKGKLAGLRLSTSMIDYQMRQKFMPDTKERDWELDNGVRRGMTLTKIKKVVGDKLTQADNANRKYHYVYKDGASTVHLHFSHMYDAGDGDDSYHLRGIFVVQE